MHAVAVRDGAVVAERGDGGLTCFMRSASKPIQALPLARARDDLDDRDLAIASASHHATPDQLAAVEALLAKAPAQEDDLELGLQPGRPPHKLQHNCSGKHAGMLALCRANGWPTQGYRLPDHPVQQACKAAHAEAADVDEAELPTATDGCGVVTFALPLERMAFAYARFEQLPEATRIADAMRAHPDLVGGPDGVDCTLMRRRATGSQRRRRGPALRRRPERDCLRPQVRGRRSRPLGPALAAFLEPLGTALPALRTEPLRNSRGEIVGELRLDGS